MKVIVNDFEFDLVVPKEIMIKYIERILNANDAEFEQLRIHFNQNLDMLSKKALYQGKKEIVIKKIEELIL